MAAALIQLVCIAVIAAGPQDTAVPGVAGLMAVLVGSLLYGTPTMQLLGLTVIGVITFGARAILRLLTGYGGLIRSPTTAQPRRHGEEAGTPDHHGDQVEVIFDE